MLGLDHIYGFYTASVPTAGRLLPTPFINPNHAGALFLLASFVAFGRWLDAERDSPWHLLAGVASSVGLLATFSRANALLWLAGLVLLGAVAVGRNARPQVRTRYLRLVVGALSVGVVAIILIGPDRWLGEMATLRDITSAGQAGLVDCWGVGAQLAGAHPFLGVGNGAFEVAAPLVMRDWNVGLIAYAHNGLLQVLAELGVVIGAFVLVLAGAGFVRMVHRTKKSAAAVAAAVGLTVLFAQNMVDFSLWLPGVGIPAVAILASICGAGLSRGARLLRVRWTIAMSIAAIGLLVLTSILAWEGSPDAGYDTARAAVAAAGDGPELTVAAADLVLAHPADFYAYHLGAALAVAGADRDLAMRLLDRAHVLAPYEPNVLARRAGLTITAPTPPPSLGEDLERLASLDHAGLERAIGLVLTPNANRAVVEAFLGGDPERIVLASRRLANPDVAERLITWGLERFPESLPLIDELGHRWSGRRERTDALDRLATQLLARIGSNPNLENRRGWARAAYMFQGVVLKWRGDSTGAWHMFMEAAIQDEATADAPLLLAGDVAAAMHRDDLLLQVIARLSEAEMNNPWPKSRLHLLRSIVAERQDDLRGAIREMQRALGFRGDIADYEDRLSALFDRVGEHTAADAAHIRAVKLRAAAKQKADASPQQGVIPP